MDHGIKSVSVFHNQKVLTEKWENTKKKKKKTQKIERTLFWRRVSPSHPYSGDRPTEARGYEGGVNLKYGKEKKKKKSRDLGELEVLRKQRANHLADAVHCFHDGVIEIVDYWNAEASFEKLNDGVGANETGTTGDQNVLGGRHHAAIERERSGSGVENLRSER